jgi:hypothetical protein
MSESAFYSITVAVVLGLAAVLYWIWITPEKIPVLGRSRFARELMAGGIASLMVSAAFFTVALFGVDSPKRFLPAFVFAEGGVVTLFFSYLLTAIPPEGSARRVAIQRLWSRILGGVCLCYFVVVLPRATALHLPDLLDRVASLFAMLLSVTLCWYSFTYRDSLGRTKNAVGVFQLFAPFLLVMLLRSIR